MADDTVPSSTFADYASNVTNSDAVSEPDQYEICMRSGFKYPAGVLIKQWDGLYIHPDFIDQRHPQDFARAVPEIPRPSVRPEGDDTFLSVGDVTVNDL